MSIGNYSGRGNNAGPAVDFFPLSGATASSPAVLITATAAAGTTIHTGDAFAQDVLYVTLSNVSAASLTVYTNLGSTATTGQQQTTLTAGQSTVAYNGNAAISKSGVFSAWTTATTGIYAFGYVARTYTATA
jgi:hypothetical protein